MLLRGGLPLILKAVVEEAPQLVGPCWLPSNPSGNYLETAFGCVPGAGAPMPLFRNSSSFASWLEACLRTASTSHPPQS